MSRISTTVENSSMMKALRKEQTASKPVWLMRQAGRYMKEYRDLRKKVDFLTLCKSPELVSHVTCEAQEKIDADAAIIFADILLITESLGFNLAYSAGEGPVLTSEHDSLFSTLKRPSREQIFDQYHYVAMGIEKTRSSLPENIPLIGFAGAPFTVSAYMIEGGKTKTNFQKTIDLASKQPTAWNHLMDVLVASTIDYLHMQIEHGADVLQLFDSWVGVLTPTQFDQWIKPHVSAILNAIPSHVPVIYFGAKTAHLLENIKHLPCQAFGISDEIDIQSAWAKVDHAPIQGNLNPEILLTDWKTIEKETIKILDATKNKPGHIFNLGHGILPQTPVEHVIDLIQLIHGYC
ncbi:MAG: uroporphyrinogen decarboxylase [Bdellovibrionota bacterium]